MGDNNNLATCSVEDKEYEEENFGYALQIVDSMAFPMVMNAIIELDVLGIIARAGPGRQLLSSEIAVSLPGVKNPMVATMMLERMLWLLATYKVVSCTVVEAKDGVEKRYGLAPVAKHFVTDHHGVSLAPLMSLSQDKVFIHSWDWSRLPYDKKAHLLIWKISQN